MKMNVVLTLATLALGAMSPFTARAEPRLPAFAAESAEGIYDVRFDGGGDLGKVVVTRLGEDDLAATVVFPYISFAQSFATYTHGDDTFDVSRYAADDDGNGGVNTWVTFHVDAEGRIGGEFFSGNALHKFKGLRSASVQLDNYLRIGAHAGDPAPIEGEWAGELMNHEFTIDIGHNGRGLWALATFDKGHVSPVGIPFQTVSWYGDRDVIYLADRSDDAGVPHIRARVEGDELVGQYVVAARGAVYPFRLKLK